MANKLILCVFAALCLSQVLAAPQAEVHRAEVQSIVSCLKDFKNAAVLLNDVRKLYNEYKQVLEAAKEAEAACNSESDKAVQKTCLEKAASDKKTNTEAEVKKFSDLIPTIYETVSGLAACI